MTPVSFRASFLCLHSMLFSDSNRKQTPFLLLSFQKKRRGVPPVDLQVRHLFSHNPSGRWLIWGGFSGLDSLTG